MNSAPPSGHSEEIHRKRRNIIMMTIVCMVIIGLLYFFYWLFVLRFEIETGDAYIGSNVVAVTAHISGAPIALYTDNTRFVKQGQLLAELDPTDYKIAYDKAQIAFRLAIRDAKLRENIEKPNTDILIEQAKESLIESYLNLKRCQILAPITGYIAKRTMEIGTWVRPETPLMAIIPLDHLWVDANFKETELKNIRVGQPVKIVTDLYGKKIIYLSHVAGISPGTGRLFTLLPAENATGNWIKIIQRVPVRIYLDEKEFSNFPLLAGLSATVTIDISDTSGEFLLQKPSDAKIMSTDVYNIPLEEIEHLIDEIFIQEGLLTHAN